MFLPFPFLAGVSSQDAVVLDCDGNYCLNELVQCQCTVTGFSLRWRIRDESMDQLGDQPYLSSSTENVTVTIAGATEFSTVLLSNVDPLVSRLSFTVQSSINGYSVECEAAGSGEDPMTSLVTVPGMMNNISNLSIAFKI